MVSFQCDGCADTVKKPKLDQHRQRCWAPFTCLDCSTTFQGQDYKKHTSCISEAEKYQGALYKGPRKSQAAAAAAAAPAPAPPAAAKAAPSPAPAAAAAEPTSPTSSIHPSRLNQFDDNSRGQANGYGHGNYNRGGPSNRGFGRGRGGFQNGPGRGFSSRSSATGENKAVPEGGMRSWGSTPVSGTPVPETPPASTPVPSTSAPAPVPTAAAVQAHISSSTSAPVRPSPLGKEKYNNKKKKKGDKGGTGSKANSKHPKAGTEVEAETSEQPAKKRKRSASPAPTPASAPAPASPATATASTTAEVPEKTLKRIRKHASKLADKSPSAPLSLASFLKSVAEGKKETLPTGDVESAAKVSLQGGKWVIDF